jgi:hypothetical protein
MNKRVVQIAIVFWLFVVSAGCASQRPVLSSNAHLTRVGSDVAARDIDECIERAKVASSEGGGSTNENVVAGAAGSSVVGAAAGGAGGAVFGNAGQGAAAGAVGGAVASLTSALMRGLFAPKPPDSSFRAFADRCLREKGYEPTGWK